MSRPGRPRTRVRGRRTAAAVALAAAAWVLVLSVAAALDDFPRGLLLLACGALVAAGAWQGVLRRGWGRVAGLAVAGVALTGGVVVLADSGYRRTVLLLGLGALVWHAAARSAFRPDVELPAAERPRRPVVVVNPRSGDGRAVRTGLAAAARERGIDVLELRPGEDLAALVRGAVEAGADAVGMAGGDGSQAVVAAVAAEAGLPYACIPSGTRNHFALDLGVDRTDVVGALDALVDGGERVVDLAEVNGRVFVNNVSLGVYAQAVQEGGYRAAKVRTLLATVPEALGARGGAQDLRWTTPGGRTMQGAAVVLVGNGQYRLAGAAGAGTRPAVDQGLLGVTVVDPPGSRERRGRRPVRQWATPEFRVEATQPVAAGVDGEATVLAPPVTFRSRPAALRVRIAAHHPGASPSAIEPVGALAALRALARIAGGGDPRQLPPRGAPAARQRDAV
ncbi:diacylglycerol kinase family enzyme [Geodermatophilus bullaregiensis]|uniref:diacylglycerol/lipid kinase family protein n=1 Tax=Geodermatophilus bullaregiensis TaxID=1564160 RepID=UPI00195BACD0|nr:diacylglycerol kinase family protein [Geodermatophilus bullaregiensis]MBM7808974.1 diacylglycerol kinase family enzyme [Geodermatophilus bullaregiensis]